MDETMESSTGAVATADRAGSGLDAAWAAAEAALPEGWAITTLNFNHRALPSEQYSTMAENLGGAGSVYASSNRPAAALRALAAALSIACGK